MEDTADEVGSVDDCLYSLGNRVAIAKILSEKGEHGLLMTELETIAYFVQYMIDEHCVVKDENINNNLPR